MPTLYFGRDDRIRTCGLFVPNEARYQTALHLDILLNEPIYYSMRFWVCQCFFAEILAIPAISH